MPAAEARRLRPQRRFPKLLGLIVAGLLAWRATAPEHQDFVSWRPFEAAKAEALRSGRPILLVVTGDSSETRRDLVREVYSHRPSARLINTSFVPVSLMDRTQSGARNESAVQALLDVHGATVSPTFVVARPDGTPVETLRGIRGRDLVDSFLRRALAAYRKPPPGGPALSRRPTAAAPSP